MIRSFSDLVLKTTAYDPDTVENDLNNGVEIAREHAMKERRHGILVTQHSYTSYTVTVTVMSPTGRHTNGANSRRICSLRTLRGSPATSPSSPVRPQPGNRDEELP